MSCGIDSRSSLQYEMICDTADDDCYYANANSLDDYFAFCSTDE